LVEDGQGMVTRRKREAREGFGNRKQNVKKKEQKKNEEEQLGIQLIFPPLSFSFE